MLDTALLNPFGIDPRDELPHPPEDKPNWTEYYYFFGFDRQTDHAVSVHIGREPTDPDIWRAVIGIYSPGGKLLVGRYFGRDGAIDGPGAGPMRVRCQEPMRRWALSFDGLLEQSDRVALSNRPHPSAIAALAKFDLVFEGAAPMWDLGKSDLSKGFVFVVDDTREESKSHHWEQICKVHGSLTLGGKTLAFSGGGNRDHSFGPRDYTPMVSSMWVNAYFPSGKALMLMGTRVGPFFIQGGYVFRNDGSPLETVRFIEAPAGDGDATPPASIPADPLADPARRHFRVVVATAAGEEIITGELTHALSSTNLSPNHELLGTDLAFPGKGFQFCECPTRYSWNGEEGMGHFERITQLRFLHETGTPS